ncbi:carboxypeptidase M32 [Candidatus Pacearchaeota archaeon CG10_big_fil_rev_8_21_14_0_10_31_9]|nr:MAG: carboxypeptidase M32 [Candidatus Pacearchaeota archaeon CG10_big_fil_rev_8_21_14_0_10_31_9]PIZ82933.1 MAG: carboxypeptidase M32 [Candidatus Pacearchaeota archaeon CG_4_10_14_0_2_um_filter_05_32_18]
MKEEDNLLSLVKEQQKEIILLSYSDSLLSWDQETYMPEKAIESKSEQMSLLSSIIHKKLTSNELFNAVKKLRNNQNIKGDDKIMIERLYKDLLKSRKIPNDFVRELSKEQSLAVKAWKEAKEKSNFKIFQPHLEKLVKLKIKEANYIKLPGHIYNSLLDSYEEGMTVEKLTPKLEKLKVDLLELLNKIKSSEKYKTQNLRLMSGNFNHQIQKEFCDDVSLKIGLEKDRARIDFSEHPFTTKTGFNDVRITTNIRKKPLFSFGSTIHESGHALYELNMPENHKYDILGNAPSLGIHESQSRFWENMIGLNEPFWRYYFPKFKDNFKINGGFEEWYKEVNFVSPSKIRIESDEVHYCLHIILRFEIELGLMEGKIKVADLPKVWNQKMKELIGVEIKNDSEGVLQDIHWGWGNFGYFPTYALGTIYAAQLYESLKEKFPKIEQDIESGDFSKVRLWLNENIHKHGRKISTEEIIKRACGEGLNPEKYISYLKEKYLKIYV